MSVRFNVATLISNQLIESFKFRLVVFSLQFQLEIPYFFEEFSFSLLPSPSCFTGEPSDDEFETYAAGLFKFAI